MTRWVTGARDGKQNGVFVRKVKHRISQENKMPSLPEKQTAISFGSFRSFRSFSLTVLYFTPNIFGTTPLSPTCHPERSGTARQKSHALTNHCRTANPAPSGAPAGGISVAERHHITPRTAQKAFPWVGKVARQQRMRAKPASAQRNTTILLFTTNHQSYNKRKPDENHFYGGPARYCAV